jgi:hypothetical protein
MPGTSWNKLVSATERSNIDDYGKAFMAIISFTSGVSHFRTHLTPAPAKGHLLPSITVVTMAPPLL